MSNPYAALCDSSEAESGSECDNGEEEYALVESVPKYHNSTTHEGGMKVKLDIVGDDDFPFVDEDISTTCKVISQIGKVYISIGCWIHCSLTNNITGENIHLLRLPQLKALRSALHPLVVEQQKKYAMDAQPTRDRNSDRNRKKRKLVDKEADDRLAMLEKNHINHVCGYLLQCN
jgi:hypothetical protein